MILKGPALLLLLSKWAVSAALTTIKNAKSGRRLYAHYGAIGESGFGGAGPEGYPWKEQWWKFVETTCGPELPHAPIGGVPCYRIVNNDSGRSIYAEAGKNWKHGVGAVVGDESTPKPDEKWFLVERVCGPNDEKCYFIVNAYSGRRLYATSKHTWEEGVGAVVNGEKVWEDQKWFIDIEERDGDSDACLDFQSLNLRDCTLSNIRSTIEAALPLAENCPNGVDEEIVHLTHLEDLEAAEYKIVNMCKGLGSCIDVWDDITINGCTYGDVVTKVEKVLPFHCEHDAETELQFFTSSETRAEMQQKIHDMCSEGWSNVDVSTFANVSPEFDDEFMNSYVAGDTFLNEETGSFQGTAVGMSIDEFRHEEAKSTVLQNFPSLEGCEQQAIMCCFGRDRQPNDNNGNCANPLDKRCVDADPADNSNLCYADGISFPDETEGDIHCHGVAWAEDENDFTAQLKINNFFYVSLYDHMYTRGYAETTVDSPEVPMCACIEDMPPVSRSDCTQVDASLKFTIAFDEDSGTLVALPHNDMYIEFNSCRGTNFANGRNQNNDLASYVHRLANDHKISREIEGQVFETLVGYANPGDNENEAACTESFKQNVGTDYSGGMVMLNAHSGRRLYASVNQAGENGFGAAAPDAPSSEDQKWHFVKSTCDGYPYARDSEGMDMPCYEILNARSGRRVYAKKGGAWGDGAGASAGYVYPDRKWVLEDAPDCGEIGMGHRCVYVVNAHSGRRLYAVPGKEEGAGVGAVKEHVEKWDGQKWIINTEDNYRTIPLAIE